MYGEITQTAVFASFVGKYIKALNSAGYHAHANEAQNALSNGEPSIALAAAVFYCDMDDVPLVGITHDDLDLAYEWLAEDFDVRVTDAWLHLMKRVRGE